MNRGTRDYLEELWLISNSSFPEVEKGRHYKEMMAQMRQQYLTDRAIMENNPQFVKAYELISSLIGNKKTN